jgi:hypothetical protein
MLVISDCYCANGVLAGATPDAMGTCRVACDDADNISCGGATTPIVYSSNIGGIFPELAARLALPSPEYECAPRSESALASFSPRFVQVTTLGFSSSGCRMPHSSLVPGV